MATNFANMFQPQIDAARQAQDLEGVEELAIPPEPEPEAVPGAPPPMLAARTPPAANIPVRPMPKATVTPPTPAATKPAVQSEADLEKVSPEELDAFTDYMYDQSAAGAFGNKPAVKYNAANAASDYKARLIKGNPVTYATWKAERPPEVANLAANADIAAKQQEADKMPASEATLVGAGGQGEAAMPALNKEGTAPKGQTKASFKDWMVDKFGHKADSIDFWDAIEIWGAALAGNEPRLYNAKMQGVKANKDLATAKEQLAEERAFQMNLDRLAAERDERRLMTMQNFESNQNSLLRGYNSSESALDRALREKELERQYKLLQGQLAGDQYGANYTGFRPQVDRSAVYGTGE